MGAVETPLGEWSVTRLRSAAHGMAHSTGLGLTIGPKGGLGEFGDAVSRQLILTKVSLVERRPENYEVSMHFLNAMVIALKWSQYLELVFFYTNFIYYSWAPVLPS